MNKKLTREQKIIKELKDKIEHLEYSVRNAQTENVRLETRLEKYKEEEGQIIGRQRIRNDFENYEIRRMTEIVRWLVNPETAKTELEAKIKSDEKNGRF